VITLYKKSRRPTLVLIPLTLLLAPAWSFSQTAEFLPEIDAYYKIKSDIRLTFQAKETREAGDPTQAEIGPSAEFYLKPLLRLKDVAAFDLDDSKARPLVFSVGFRYVPSPDKPTVWRMELVATPHFPLIAKILLTDRNRADLDWSNDGFVWRYRNRLGLERAFTIRSYHPSPHVAAEAFYQSQYQKWSTTALYAGCVFPLGKHLQLDPYYEHQNITGKHPNQQLEQFGLILNIFIQTRK
jgi:hypothetical protein